MKFAAAIKNSWDNGMVGTALADWCQGNPASAAQMIERLRDQNSARLKLINDKTARINDLETAKVSIDMDTHFDGQGMRVFGRVVDWQPEDYEAGGAGKGIGVRLLCEYESDNFGMRRASTISNEDRRAT
jgi:hypothetical protein